MIKIYLCDDNTIFLENFEAILHALSKKHQIPIVVRSFDNGEALLFHLQDQQEVPDIIYLDMIMPKLNGIDTAKKIRDLKCYAKIIFLTATEEYVYDSFEVNPFHYIRKNACDKEKIEPVFLKACQNIKHEKSDYFTFEQGKKIKTILYSTIIYFEIRSHIVIIHTIDQGEIEYYSSMKLLEEALQEKSSFLRIHRSFIVNMAYIISLENKTITLSTQERFKLGITYEKSVKEAFLSYLGK